MSERYVLDEYGEPRAEDDLLKWAAWFENNDNRRLALDRISDSVRVSTVFLGLDHGFGEGKPVLWETIIFGGECDQYQDRYTNREDALAGHAKALEMAKSSCLTPPPNHPQKEP